MADAVARTRKLSDMKGRSKDHERWGSVVKEWQMRMGLHLKVVES